MFVVQEVRKIHLLEFLDSANRGLYYYLSEEPVRDALTVFAMQFVISVAGFSPSGTLPVLSQER